MSSRFGDGYSFLADSLVKRLTFDVLHDDKIFLVLRDDVVDGDYVGMIEFRCNAGFPEEPSTAVFRGRGTCSDALDGDMAVETPVLGLVNFARASGADKAENSKGMQSGRIVLRAGCS